MTSGDLLRFLDNLPFEPFIIFLSDGRQIAVRHPEMASVQRFGVAARIRHDSDLVELVDIGLIVSIQTEKPSAAAFLESPEEDAE